MRAGVFRAFAVRAFAMLILVFSTPGTAQVIHDAMFFAAEVDCCGDGADDKGQESGPGDCADCMCCAHGIAVPVSAVAAVEEPRVVRDGGMLVPSRYGEGPLASGYRALPFRPPVG